MDDLGKSSENEAPTAKAVTSSSNRALTEHEKELIARENATKKALEQKNNPNYTGIVKKEERVLTEDEKELSEQLDATKDTEDGKEPAPIVADPDVEDKLPDEAENGKKISWWAVLLIAGIIILIIILIILIIVNAVKNSKQKEEAENAPESTYKGL